MEGNFTWLPYPQWTQSGPVRNGRGTHVQQEYSWHPQPYAQQPLVPPYGHYFASSYEQQPQDYYNPYFRPHPYAYFCPPPPPPPPPPQVHYPFLDLRGIPRADALQQTGLSLRQEKQRRRDHLRKISTTDKDDLVDNIFVDAQISAQRIKLNWKLVSGSSKIINYVINCVDKDNNRWSWEQPWAQTEKELKTIQGQTYTVTIEAKEYNGTVTARAVNEYKATFSMEELDMLYTKAMDIASSNFHQVDVVYRCKPKVYWDDIHIYRRDVMETYIKDFNGQPANLINGIIKGLFFSVRALADGALPSQSPFGDVRMMIRAEVLLNFEEHNLYFADSYCNQLTHYVTIVVSRKNSEVDRYCQASLKRLPEDNPFLRIRRSTRAANGQHYVFHANRAVWVEIYYTEDVPLNVGRFDSVLATGAGTSRIGGLPNNKRCSRCNLYGQTHLLPGTNEDIPTIGIDKVDSTSVVVGSQVDQCPNPVDEDIVELARSLVNTVCSIENHADTLIPVRHICPADEELADLTSYLVDSVCNSKTEEHSAKDDDTSAEKECNNISSVDNVNSCDDVVAISENNENSQVDEQDLSDLLFWLVNSVCHVEEEFVLSEDTISQSDYDVDIALINMNRQLRECNNHEVNSAAENLMDYYQLFKKDRNSILSTVTAITECVNRFKEENL